MALPDITFAEGDARALANSLKSLYEAVRQAAGEPDYKLADADPMRLVQLSEAELLAQVNTDIDATGKGNLLYYAGEETIEHLGYLYGERGARLQPTAAVTTIRYTLSAVRPAATTIPAGYRTTPDNTLFFATAQSLEIPAGSLSGDVLATCSETGTVGNGFTPGEINSMVDLLPFVASAVNITESSGGTELEDIEVYRARIQILPESFSVAGPDGAYEFWAKTASADIVDVAVWSPEPGYVNIVPLMQGGQLPTTDILDAVYEICSSRTVRPLTDFVQVLSPALVIYDIEVRYWISNDDSANSSTIQEAVQAAVQSYIEWQNTKLGRDLNPSKLHQLVMAAGAKRAEVIAPVFTVLQHDEVATANAQIVTYGGLEDA